jgi:heat shock protein HtpX
MPIPQPRGLLWRAIGAFALMIGFYGLAIAILGLLWLGAYVQIVYADHIGVRYLLFAIAGSVIILAGIIPRRDKFVEPGLRLQEEQHPRLFREIASTARAAEQEPPRDVYLVPDLNAWVAQRGGRLGLGGRRIMGVGLPLLSLLTVSQLRAVLAHEFGHYHGGDTRLGPVIYRTRAAISRTVAGLQRHRSILQIPFTIYAKLYLRITYAISRQQEYAADALAAAVAGSGPLADGLETIHRSAPAFAMYWHNEYMPIVGSGYYAPIVEGFAKFMRDPRVESLTGEAIEKEKARTARSPYETHPPLRDRLDAIRGLPAGAALDTSPAASLLEDLDTAEERLIHQFLEHYTSGPLKPIAWGEVASTVYLNHWRELIRERGAWLSGFAPESLPDLTRDLRPLAAAYQEVIGPLPRGEAFQQIVTMAVGASLALKLSKRGFVLNARPALGFIMRKGNQEISPFGVLPRIATGDLSVDKWRALCVDTGVAGEDLGSVE